MNRNNHSDRTEGPFSTAAQSRCVDPTLRSLLIGHLAGDLTDDSARSLELHLRECARCQADQVLLTTVDRIVSSNPKKFFDQ